MVFSFIHFIYNHRLKIATEKNAQSIAKISNHIGLPSVSKYNNIQIKIVLLLKKNKTCFFVVFVQCRIKNVTN